MKRLSRDLKRALNALASQDASDFLPMREKMAALGREQTAPQPKQSAVQPMAAPHKKQVVVLLDNQELEPVLGYALDLCRQQNAQLHVILHFSGAVCAEQLKAKLDASGIIHICTARPNCSVDDLLHVIESHHQADYLIAIASDQLVKEVVTRPELDRRTRIVLMERSGRGNMKVA